jgi:hypothetical protein
LKTARWGQHLRFGGGTDLDEKRHERRARGIGSTTSEQSLKEEETEEGSGREGG